MAKSASSDRLSSIHKLKSLFGGGSRFALSRSLLRRHLWVAPVLALVALAFTATWLRARLEQAMQEQIEGNLTALRDADVTALDLWLASERQDVITAAETPAIREPILALVQREDEKEASRAQLLDDPAAKALAKAVVPWLERGGYIDYKVYDLNTRVVAAHLDGLVGDSAVPGHASFLKDALHDCAIVSRPFPSVALLPDETGQLSAGVPTMFAAAPVHDDNGQVVAVLAFRIPPEKEFSQILNVGRPGKTGETYAFDAKGLMLSRSRFEDQLKEIGLLPDSPTGRSILGIELRDPGVDMTKGNRPRSRRSEQPFTSLAEGAISGKAGVNVQGYRDYRGVETVGAWRWLPEYGFGVGTEMDKDEALRPLYILRTVFWSLFGLLTLAAATMLGMTLLAGKLERRMREAVIAAGKVGQYSLEEKIGEGGMGAVYRGRHAMLRRPTAVKLIEPSKTTDLSVARFEREVQLTSQLNHPNTITVYDYGRTDEGVFYYAMEYLEGLSLQSLVERYGTQPDGRVINILTQVCGSLFEAHSMGLIHRDIKPANIMLTQRGGLRDFVKLLDFGLVKAIDSAKQATLTAADSITGTLLYMPPESIQDPDRADARSDLYSLGAVGYFLLTGRPVFEANNVLEIVRQHVQSTPALPSQYSQRSICVDLEKLLLRCLGKFPQERPQSAAELAGELARCVPQELWTARDAEVWWNQYEGSAQGETTEIQTTPVNLSHTLAFSQPPGSPPS